MGCLVCRLWQCAGWRGPDIGWSGCAGRPASAGKPGGMPAKLALKAMTSRLTETIDRYNRCRTRTGSHAGIVRPAGDCSTGGVRNDRQFGPWEGNLAPASMEGARSRFPPHTCQRNHRIVSIHSTISGVPIRTRNRRLAQDVETAT